MANRIKLSILGISFSQVQAGAYALIFAEESGIRRLPIVIGTPEAQSIAIVMEEINPPRPLTHDLMYEIFQKFDIKLKEVFIYKFEDGAFFAELLLEQGDKEFVVDSRTSDAVAIALRTNSPIYTTEEIMQNMAIVFDENDIVNTDSQKNEPKSNADSDSSNMKATTLKELKRRLQEAIENENYELATKLRDEINNREDTKNG